VLTSSEPSGYLAISAIFHGLLLFISFLTAFIAAYIFVWSHYGIKFNEFGVISKGYHILGKEDDDGRSFVEKQKVITSWPEDKHERRKVSIATLKYEIVDWKLKVKIGGPVSCQV